MFVKAIRERKFTQATRMRLSEFWSNYFLNITQRKHIFFKHKEWTKQKLTKWAKSANSDSDKRSTKSILFRNEGGSQASSVLKRLKRTFDLNVLAKGLKKIRFLTRMISSIGSQTNLFKRSTELLLIVASKIHLAHRFCTFSNLWRLSTEQLPQTLQQYSRIRWGRVLYKIFRFTHFSTFNS